MFNKLCVGTNMQNGASFMLWFPELPVRINQNTSLAKTMIKQKKL